MITYAYFKFKSYKEQIEEEILGRLKSWEEEMEQRKKDNLIKKEHKKDHLILKILELQDEIKPIIKPYGILVSLEIYNKIREIYSCDITFPQDTKEELFGLKIGILKKESFHKPEIVMVDKKDFFNLTSEEKSE